jgi:predicted transcriptional regulator
MGSPDAMEGHGMNSQDKSEIVELTADIVAAYVGNNAVPTAELPNLISDVYNALANAMAGTKEKEIVEEKPAVPVRRSVTPDAVICLEDGKKFKSLKRHLRTHHNMTPEEYREKWGLGTDYPMVAPNYAEARSSLAKKMGLGQRRRRS